jgi:hypothetical protein
LWGRFEGRLSFLLQETKKPQKSAAFKKSVFCPALFHEKHLASSFNGAIELALVMRRQPSVFARKNAALVRHKLPQQGGVFEIERIDRKVDLGFRARSPHFHRPAARALVLLWMSFAWHIYLISLWTV